MSIIQGVVPGTVKSVDDPDKKGRLEIHFPWLSDDNKTYWARVATLMSGSERGSWFMPEKDDEVLVAFEHGDAQHPYVIGYLWNGQDKPPNKDIDPTNTKLRRLRTVSGHQVDFDDRKKTYRIFMKTQGEHKVEFIDKPDEKKGITVTSKHGHVIHLNDVEGKESVTVSTKGGHKIEMIDSPDQKVSVSTNGKHKLEMVDTPDAKISLSFKGAKPSITMDQQSMKLMFSDTTGIEMSSSGLKVKFSDSSYIELTAASLTIKNSTLVDINP